MKIVIANSVGILDNGLHTCLFPSRWDAAGVAHSFSYYPYELAYLSSLIKRELPEHKTILIDGNHEQLTVDAYIERLKPLDADMIVCECSALTYMAMTRVVNALRAINPYLITILTGPYGTYQPGWAKADGWTFVIPGEYEHKVLAILRGEAEPTGYVDLDTLPWPEDADIRRIEYTEGSNIRRGLVQLYATRGCPLACTFCVVPTYYGGHGKSHKSHRVRDVENVCAEIEYLARKYNGRFNGAFFNDEAHNANPEWLATFAEALIGHGLNRYFYDAMCGYWGWSEELVSLVSRAGYGYIRVGIESFSETVGKNIKKVVFHDKLVEFMEWCKAAGILVYGTTQIGAQGSSAADDLATLSALWDLKERGLLHRWQHSVSTPQPGTPFYQQVKSAGYLVTEDISEYNGGHAVVSWPDYPAAEIDRVRAEYVRRAP